MRLPALAVLAMAAISCAEPAQAQTSGSNYPVCLHVYGLVTYTECSYASLSQCNMSASGRAAQCVINPNAAGADDRPVRKRHRGVY